MPSADPLEPFRTFLTNVRTASNESQKRHLFTILASTGFGDTELATTLALGAEYQVRFSNSGLVRRGAVDSFFGSLVIEFETDLTATYSHALDQLRGYVAGAWTEDGSSKRDYLAVACDGERWEVLVPRLTDPSLGVDADNIFLEPSETWAASGDAQVDAATLRDFLNRLFYREFLLPPTARNFASDFGLRSPAFIASSGELNVKLVELGDDSQLSVLRDKWADSLEIAYGSVDASDDLFVKHTYLAVLSRLLVWAALEKRPPTPNDLDGLLAGSYFVGRRIANFVEADFFRWHAIPSNTDAGRTWIALSRHLLSYDLAAVRDDVLKPLYEELVDPDTRHDLGEYYTPGWLARRIVDRILSTWDWNSRLPRLIDPACGSGTFLLAAIHQVRARQRARTDEDELKGVLASICGVDVHPLAVTIARATYLLAIQDLIPSAGALISIPVFLSNSLNVPELVREASLFGDAVVLVVEEEEYPVPEDFVHAGDQFDAAMDHVQRVAEAFGATDDPLDDARQAVRARLGSSLDNFDASGSLTDQLAAMSAKIAELIRRREDSIYGFLLRNLYRPSILRKQFDFVVGNPPWLSVGAIEGEDYKDLIVRLVHETNIAPRAAGEQANTEIATLFLPLALEYLSDEGSQAEARVGLVLPRSLMTASHHRYVREGRYTSPFDVSEVWDLSGVTPLFNIPASVIFASRSVPSPGRVKPGLMANARLPEKEADETSVQARLRTAQCGMELAFLGERSAWRPVDVTRIGEAIDLEARRAAGAYAARFRQGAILYPQTLLVVEVAGGADRTVPSVLVTTDPSAAAAARVLPAAAVNHVVESVNLYSTAAAEHLLPYIFDRPLWTVVLPTVADPGDTAFGPVDSATLRTHGRVDTAAWLDWAEEQWASARKPGERRSLSERLDYHGHLSAQGTMGRYLVLYTATGSRPVAVVLDRESTFLRLPFVARDRTYWFSTSDAREAFYLAAFLNSSYVESEIVDFVNLGLLGPRDINKRAVDVPWPVFDPHDPGHVELAARSANVATVAEAVLPTCPQTGVGRRRVWLRAQLAGPLSEIEQGVRSVAGTT